MTQNKLFLSTLLRGKNDTGEVITKKCCSQKLSINVSVDLPVSEYRRKINLQKAHEGVAFLLLYYRKLRLK